MSKSKYSVAEKIKWWKAKRDFAMARIAFYEADNYQDFNGSLSVQLLDEKFKDMNEKLAKLLDKYENYGG